MSALALELVGMLASLDIISYFSIIFNFRIDYIMFSNIINYGLVYGLVWWGLVWLDYGYKIVRLGYVDHDCDLYPGSLC